MAQTQKLANIGIIGKGAIGINIAANLMAYSSIETTLFVREQHDLNQILMFQSVDGETRSITSKQSYISSNSLESLDLLIIPVKHYQIENLLKLLKPLIKQSLPILLLHNGMGGIELANKHLPNNPLLAGITTDGVYKTSPSSFKQTAVGKLEVGSVITDTLFDAPNSLIYPTDEFKVLHPNLLWRNDIIFALYQKLAINAAINPLTAIKNCKNGELSGYKAEVEAIKEEVFDLYEFMHLPIDNHELSQQIDEVISLTRNNYSSMHQDLHHGRETEIEGIVGFLLEKAQETGMKMTYVQSLYDEVKLAEK